MTLPDTVQAAHRGLYLERADVLVIADLHLGRGHSAGIDVPLGDAGDLDDRLARLLERFSPATVVIAGDLLDAFDTVPPGVHERLSRLCDAIERTGATIEFLAGNHDTLLSQLTDRDIRDEYVRDETVIGHGHQPLSGDIDLAVIGHVHPAIKIEGVKRPCYLVGPGRSGTQVIVLPAFSRAVRGTVMTRRAGSEIDVPIISTSSFEAFRPVVRDEAADETLAFPPFATLRSFL